MNSSSINHLFQDHQGYVWMATQGGGANRFDGKSFEHFTKKTGLSSNFLTYIFESSSHDIWFASEQGATQFQQGKFKNFGKEDGLCDGVVYALCQDSAGTLWFATQTEGIRSFSHEKFQSFTEQHGLPSNTCYTLQAFQHKVWVGTDNGIAVVDNHRILVFPHPAAKNKGFFSSCVDYKGNLWFGAMDGTVLCISPEGKARQVVLPPTVQSDFIGGMAADKSGNLWLATNHGLLKVAFNELNLPSFTLFGKKEGLSVEAVQTVLVDYENNVWAGTLYGGVNILSTESFGFFNENHGLSSTNTTALLPYSSNQSLVGTTAGLFLFTRQSKFSFEKIDLGIAYSNLAISDLAWGKKNELWIAGEDGVCVFTIKGKKAKFLKEMKDSKGEKLISPQKIKFDKEGNAWIANYGSGLTKIRPNGKTEYFETKTGFPSNNVLTVFIDPFETVWVGTHDQGLIQMDKDGKFQSVKELKNESVWSLASDLEGTVFVGTGDYGLFKKDRKHSKFRPFLSKKQRLKSNFIPGLVYDTTRQCLWIGGEEGFCQVRFEGEGFQLKNYGESDGFKPVTINPNGLLPKADGLFLGAVNGLVVFNAAESNYSLPPLKASLKAIRINYQKEDLNDFANDFDPNTHLPLQLNLPYNKNNLSFDINAFSPKKVLFQYKLDGQDEEWTEPSSYPTITYTNLIPGKTYQLQVRCFRESNPSEITQLSFPIAIQLPWWETRWFWAIILICLLAGIWLFIRYREQNLKQQNLVLESTVQERTEEILTQKEKIEQTLEEKEGLLKEKEMLLKEIHHRVKNNLQTISSLLMLQANSLQDEKAKKAIQESQSRVRSIALLHQKLYQSDGLETVEFSAFVQDLVQQIQPIYQDKSKEISIKLNMDECYLLIDKAIPMGLMVNEWITNSFKYAFYHGTAGDIQIRLKHLPAREDLKWELSYSDSGPGFEEQVFQQPARTLGLKLIKLLSQQLGGQLHYQQKPSTFTFQFK